MIKAACRLTIGIAAFVTKKKIRQKKKVKI